MRVVISFTVALSFLVFAILLPNTGLVWQLFSQTGSLSIKTKILVGLLGGIKTNFTFTNAVFIIIIALLFGVYVSFVAYFLRKRKGMVEASGAKKGGIGSIVGILGIGCSSCGSFVLSTIFSTAGAVSIIAFLPFRGREFAFLAVLLLLFSIRQLSKAIENIDKCHVKMKGGEKM